MLHHIVLFCIALYYFATKNCIVYCVASTILQVIWLCNLLCSPAVLFAFVEHCTPNYHLQPITLQYITSCRNELHRNVVHCQDIYPLQCTAICHLQNNPDLGVVSARQQARQKPWVRNLQIGQKCILV